VQNKVIEAVSREAMLVPGTMVSELVPNALIHHTSSWTLRR